MAGGVGGGLNLVQKVDARMRYEGGCAVWDDVAEVRAAEPERSAAVAEVRERIGAVADRLTAKVRVARNTLREKMRVRREAPVVADLVERAAVEEKTQSAKAESRSCVAPQGRAAPALVVPAAEAAGKVGAPAGRKKRGPRGSGRPAGRPVSAETLGMREVLRLRVSRLRGDEVVWFAELHESKVMRKQLVEWAEGVEGWTVERRVRTGVGGVHACVRRAKGGAGA